ncbi:MAG: hypothetical protein KC413_11560 [Anaerolineales bacterium]|nr:hypothetical protein [Anaerolineales bacterium]
MGNKTVLISVNFLAEIPDDVVDDPEFNELNKLENELADLAEKINSEIKLEWESIQTIVLNPNTMNCGKCESCGRWVSNREANDSIPQLNIAGMHEGKLLCDECLPKNHKLAF